MTDKESLEKMRLVGRIQQVVNAYEHATTPQQRYKAESELCRLVDRLSGGTDQGIQSGDKYYVTPCKRDGEYRIPIKVVVVEGIPPIELSSRVMDFLVDRTVEAFQTPLYDPVQVQRMEDQLRAFQVKLLNRGMIKEG